MKRSFAAEGMKAGGLVTMFLGSDRVDRTFFADVPESRFAKAAKAGDVVQAMLIKSRVRLVSIGYPTKEEAADNRLGFSTYEKMHWDAVNANYEQISEGETNSKRFFEEARW